MPNLSNLLYQKLYHRNIIPVPTSQKRFRIRIRSNSGHTMIQTMTHIPY